MADFPPDWLQLRESYDRAARSKDLLERLASWTESKRNFRVVDLGAGTGSTFRAVRPFIRCAASWTFVDHDPALLKLLAHDGDRIEADLSTDLEALVADADLITASALIDLVSRPWLERLRACATPLYSALTFDGRMAWRPADPFDRRLGELFCQHQERDKGFGRALGPNSVRAMQELFGASLQECDSNWRFTPQDRTIQRELIGGMAAAAMEMAERRGVEDWMQRRLQLVDAGESWLTIGHKDHLWLM